MKKPKPEAFGDIYRMEYKSGLYAERKMVEDFMRAICKAHGFGPGMVARFSTDANTKRLNEARFAVARSLVNVGFSKKMAAHWVGWHPQTVSDKLRVLTRLEQAE